MTTQRPIERIQSGDPTGRPVYDVRRADAYMDQLEAEVAEWQDRCARLAEEAMHWKGRAQELVRSVASQAQRTAVAERKLADERTRCAQACEARRQRSLAAADTFPEDDPVRARYIHAARVLEEAASRIRNGVEE